MSHGIGANQGEADTLTEHIGSSLLMPFTFPLKSMEIPRKCGQAAGLGSLQCSRETQCSYSKSLHWLSSLFVRTLEKGLIEAVGYLRKHSGSQLLHLSTLSFIYWTNTNGKQAGVKRSVIIKNKHDSTEGVKWVWVCRIFRVCWSDPDCFWQSHSFWKSWLLQFLSKRRVVITSHSFRMP